MPINPNIPLSIDANSVLGGLNRGLEKGRQRGAAADKLALEKQGQDERIAQMRQQAGIQKQQASQQAEKFRTQSLATASLELLPMLQGDVDAGNVIGKLRARKQMLLDAGITNTQDTDEAIAMAEAGDFKSLAEDATSAVQIGFSTGLLKSQDSDLGRVISGLGPDGKAAFFQVDGSGNTRKLEGFTPQDKSPLATFTMPDGTTMQIGGGAPNKQTVNKVTAEQVELGDTLDLLKDINTMFKPKYHTLSNRFDNFVTSSKALAGADISESDRQDLNDFKSYKANVSQNQSTIINKISGAAVSPSEAKRMDPFILKAEDDPITAQAKLRNYTERVELSMARRNWLLHNGRKVGKTSFQKFPIMGMKEIIKTRSAELLNDLTSKNPNMDIDQIKQLRREQLRIEFGM